MAKAVIYSDEDVLAAQQALRRKTARKVGKTRSQVAEFLADDIRKAIEQGYSLKDIKNILAEAGIAVSISKIQAVLEREGQTIRNDSADSLKKKTPDSSSVIGILQAGQNERKAHWGGLPESPGTSGSPLKRRS